VQYTYDVKGNMTADANKGFAIVYNHLNLPVTFTKGTDRKPTTNPIFSALLLAVPLQKNRKEMAKRYTREEKSAILEAYSARRESGQRFSKRYGVSLPTLYSWRKQAAASFVEVAVDSGNQMNGLRLLAGEVCLEFTEAPSAQYLISLLKGLGLC
jgi:hypothetical protein